MVVTSSTTRRGGKGGLQPDNVLHVCPLGHRGYVPAGKLELYRVTPSQEEVRGQEWPHKDSRHLTPEPTPAPVSSVPVVTQVSLGEGWGLPPHGHLEWGALTLFLCGEGPTL